MWADLWCDGCAGRCNKDGDFPKGARSIWVLLKSGVELSGSLDHLFESGGVVILREAYPQELEFNIGEVAAYQLILHKDYEGK